MWDVFICHASEDKDAVARPLAQALRRLGLRVWYDEFSISVGDSLRRSIDKGLSQSRFGVVILSTNFFKKEWPQAELGGLLGKHMDGRKVILPVWHDVSADEIRRASPLVSDLAAASTKAGVDSAAEEILRTIVGENVVTDSNQMTSATHNPLTVYAESLTADIHNNLVLELYDKSHYEDLCITPLVQAMDSDEGHDVQDISQLARIPRCSIVGEPGSGKTTALRLLALELLRSTPLHVVPIYLPLASFDRSERRHSPNFLDYINEELSIFGCDSMDSLLNAASCEAVLLLDGWDEITEDGRNQIKRFLTHNDVRFIVTSRPEMRRTLPQAERFEMHPLSLMRIRQFIELRIKEKRKSDDLYRWITDNPQVLKLARNPLNLSILGIVYLERGQVRKINKSRLFERAFEAILRQHHRANLHPYDGDFARGDKVSIDIESVLERLAYKAATSGDGRFFTLRELELATMEALGRPQPEVAAILTARLSIVRDRRSGRFEFFHAWYQEFLAARYILRSGMDLVDELKNPRLAECLPYVVGLSDLQEDAKSLLVSLPIRDPFTYCRAVAEGSFSAHVLEVLVDRVISYGETHIPPLPVRLELAHALANLGTAAVPVLIRVCRSESKSDYGRRSALEAIALLASDDNRFAQLLIELLDTKSKGLLWHVIEQLGNREEPGAESKLRGYCDDPDPVTAGDSVWALRKICRDQGSMLPEKLVQGLMRALSSHDPHVQGHALRTLGRLRIENAGEALRNHLRQADSAYRWIVPEAAALIGGEAGLSILEEALDDADIKVRASALFGLGRIEFQIPIRVQEMIEYYQRDDTWVQFLDETVGNIARATLIKLQQTHGRGAFARIYVSRHCTTTWNRERRLQGKVDLSLADIGLAEARENVASLQTLGLSRIVSSTARRAYETAQVYANALNIPLHSTPRLRELDHGQWEGERVDELMRDPNSQYSDWLRDPGSVPIPHGGESVRSAQQRILEAIKDIAMTFRDETVLVVTHKHIAALLFCGLSQSPMSCFQQCVIEDTHPHLLSRNEIAVLCEPNQGGESEGLVAEHTGRSAV